MTNRNQTWSEGGSEKGVLVRDEVVPIPPEEIADARRRERLRNFPTQPQTLGTIANAVSDLIRHLGLDV